MENSNNDNNNNNNNNNTIYLKLSKTIANANKGQLYPVYNIYV